MKLRYNGFLLLAAAMLLTGMLAVGCSTTQKASDAQDNVSETVSAAQPGEDSEQGGGNKVSVPTAPEGTIFGAQKITSDEFLNLIAEKKYVSPAKFGLVLYYDYAKLPVLSDGKTFFLTVDSDRTEGESWGNGCLLANVDCTFAVLDDDAQPGLDSIMREGKSLRLYVIADEVYTAPEIIFTTLPVMTIDTHKGKGISREDTPCDITVLTPRNGSSAAYTDASAAMIRIRGATSSSLPKTSLRLTLYKDDYSDTNKLPLLGMRKDDDWILYASYSDEAKIRDATGWSLWSKMGAYIVGDKAQGTINLRYTEVILNGHYNGFYVFMERFDQKTLNLGEDDALFVVKTWEVPPSDQMRELPPATTFFVGVERKYPDADEIKVGGYSGWGTFADFVKAVYESDGETFRKTIDKCANVQNMLDYWLYLQIIMGEDNLWKNTFYAVIGGYVHSFPWDLDVTFGLRWNGGVKNYLYQDKNTAVKSFDFNCGRRLIKYYPGAANYVKNRWRELYDNGIVTAQGIMEIARGYWDDLWRSGAYQRNLMRWPDTSYVEDLDYFETTMKRRIEYLDDYIASLTDAGE